MPKILAALPPALLLALAACAMPPREPAPPSADRSEGLVSSLQAEVLPDSVRFVLQVTNAGSEPLAITYPSGQSFDFAVRDGDRELWRWSADRMFTQAVRTDTLSAGETVTHTASWHPPAGTRGRLTAHGWLTSSSHPVEETTSFVLP